MIAVDSIATGGNPVNSVINSAGIGFVSAGGWVNAGYVFSYDAVDHTLLRGANNPIEVGIGSMDIALDSLGILYSAGQMANSVTKFDAGGSVIRAYNVGAGPLSIAIVDSRTSVDEAVSVPEGFGLKSPYPNPFNSSVVLPFEGEASNNAVIEIFDISGRLVQKLSLLPGNSINRNMIWHGADFSGQKVVSGIYFGRLAGTSQAVKMVLLR